MIPWLSAIVGLYALISIAGGVEGFVKANSIASLAAGAGGGVLLLVGLYLTKKNPTAGYAMTAVVTLILVGGMFPRYMKSHAVWPAAIITFGGIAVLIAHIVAHFSAKKA